MLQQQQEANTPFNLEWNLKSLLSVAAPSVLLIVLQYHRPPQVHMLSLARPCPAIPVCQTHSPGLKFAKGNDFCAIPRKILTEAWVIIPGFCLGPRILETMEFLLGEEITPWMDDTSHPGHEMTPYCPRLVMPHGLGSMRATEPALEIMNYKKKKKKKSE